MFFFHVEKKQRRDMIFFKSNCFKLGDLTCAIFYSENILILTGKYIDALGGAKRANIYQNHIFELIETGIRRQLI